MLELVSSILRAYQKDHGLDQSTINKDPPIRTRLLHPYIEERGIVDRIFIEEVDFESNFIVAQVQKYLVDVGPYVGTENQAIIYYAKNQNYCWRRFGVCKEMYHCMIDRQQSDRISDLKSLKTLLELLVADTTRLTGIFQPLNREQQAELLALETLFPVEFREIHLSDVTDGRMTYLTVAEKYKIPEDYVAIAYQKNYYEATKDLRGKLIDLR